MLLFVANLSPCFLRALSPVEINTGPREESGARLRPLSSAGDSAAVTGSGGRKAGRGPGKRPADKGKGSGAPRPEAVAGDAWEG